MNEEWREWVEEFRKAGYVRDSDFRKSVPPPLSLEEEIELLKLCFEKGKGREIVLAERHFWHLPLNPSIVSWFLSSFPSLKKMRTPAPPTYTWMQIRILRPGFEKGKDTAEHALASQQLTCLCHKICVSPARGLAPDEKPDTTISQLIRTGRLFHMPVVSFAIRALGGH